MKNMNIVNLPDNNWYFGKYGWKFIPEELKEVFEEVTKAYEEAKNDEEFVSEYNYLLTNYVWRPSPLFFAKNLTDKFQGAKIYLKREDLNHTWAHKINHTLGEALLAKRMWKNKLIAETWAGQHWVALATAAALVWLECEIHMGAIDVVKQKQNVLRMKMLWAKVVTVESWWKCLKDAVDSAFEVFLKNYEEYFFAIWSVVWPHPYPMIVRDFQSIVWKEAREQFLNINWVLPNYLIACVGWWSNAIWLFTEFLSDDVKMIWVEPAWKSFKPWEHAATLTLWTPWIIHWMFTYLLQDNNWIPMWVHSIASWLDYPWVGPEHSYLKDISRVQYVSINDKEALEAFVLLSKTEWIIPALESSHAVAHAIKIAKNLWKDKTIIVNLSWRWDKDIDYVWDLLNDL